MAMGVFLGGEVLGQLPSGLKYTQSPTLASLTDSLNPNPLRQMKRGTGALNTLLVARKPCDPKRSLVWNTARPRWCLLVR